MEGKMYNLVNTWFLIFASLSYCFAIGKKIPKGTTRLFFLLPVICLFLIIPLNISSIQFRGMTTFFITWLGNFKLLLFAFDEGPLSNISFNRFVLCAALPIEILENPSHLKGKNKESPHIIIKGGILLAIVFLVHEYHVFIHPMFIFILYFLQTYLSLDVSFAMLTSLTRAVLRVELEPHFNKPYLSTSLQNFWGKRWNLMVPSILRPTVYYPLRKICSRFVGRRWVSLPAILGTFAVSAIMHELIFYYLGCAKPVSEVTWYFMLHGFCVMTEVAVKKVVNGRWSPPRFISTPLTLGFVVVTGCWLFSPLLHRCKVLVTAF